MRILVFLLLAGCATAQPGQPVACTQEVKGCADGSTVARDPQNNCEYRPCPRR